LDWPNNLKQKWENLTVDQFLNSSLIQVGGGEAVCCWREILKLLDGQWKNILICPKKNMIISPKIFLVLLYQLF